MHKTPQDHKRANLNRHWEKTLKQGQKEVRFPRAAKEKKSPRQSGSKPINPNKVITEESDWTKE